MANFWYGFIEKQSEYWRRVDPTFTINSQYTDTDSIVFEIVSKTGIKLEDIQSHDKEEAAKWFDLSTYSEEELKRLGFEEIHVFKKVPGKMKNEIVEGFILEFVALQSKCYSYIVMLRDGTILTCSRHKGIKSNIIKQLLTENYRRKVHNGAEIDLATMKVKSSDSIENSPMIGDVVDDDGYINQYLIATRDKANNCPSLAKDPTKNTICTIKQRKKVLNPFESKRFEVPGSIETLAFGHPRILEYDPDIDYSIDPNENRHLMEGDNPDFDEFEDEEFLI